MTKQNNKRKRIFANRIHREMFFLTFSSMMIPTLITAVGLFYLIFNITAREAGIPETIAYTVIPAAQKVIVVLVGILPIVILIILLFAHRITHQVVGPLDRIIRELDEVLKGERKGPLHLRKSDKLWPLIQRINKLIAS